MSSEGGSLHPASRLRRTLEAEAEVERLREAQQEGLRFLNIVEKTPQATAVDVRHWALKARAALTDDNKEPS